MKAKYILTLFGAMALLINCQQTAGTEVTEKKEGLIKVTILYPNAEGKTFDMDYYADRHMPMVARLLGDSLKMLEIDKGIGGRPDEPMPYLAIGYLYFDQLSAYQNSFGPHAEEILGDIPNYTNTQPVLQISEVLQ